MPNPSSLQGALVTDTVFHDRYKILRCMKVGGMGAIYEVLDQTTRRRRALKTMLPEVVHDDDLRERFRQEATVTADVQSEHIVEVFDAGVDEVTGVPFIVMELLRGDDLGAVVANKGPFEPAVVVNLLCQASLALERTHALDIVHRDLKPENLFLVSRDSGEQHVKVLDFGIAKFVAQSTRPQTTGVIGTPLYMAPEQAAGDGAVGPAADLYALAHIAFTLLTGSAFWEAAAKRLGSPAALLLKVMQGATQSASARAKELGIDLTGAFDAWFATATALSPAARFATARELTESLAEALGLSLPRDSVPERSPGRASTPAATKRLGTPPELAGSDRAAPVAHQTGPAVSSDRRPLQRRRPPWLGAAAAALAVAVGGYGLVRVLRNGTGSELPAPKLRQKTTEMEVAKPVAPETSAVANAGVLPPAVGSLEIPAPTAQASVSKVVGSPPLPPGTSKSRKQGSLGPPRPPKGAGTAQDPSDIW